MELKDFFKLLYKYLPILIILPIITVVVSYFLVRKLPKEYVSSGQISTGLTDQSRQIIDPLGANLGENRINAQFSNLIELMKLKKMIDMVSYNLIIHDLSSPKPYRQLGKDYIHMSAAQKIDAIKVYTSKLQSLEALSLDDTYQEWLNGLLIEMSYDERSLRKTMEISREENSDFLSVSATTENAQLSAFMVNTLCQGFIAYHNSILKRNQEDAITFLTKVLDDKRKALDSVTQKLQQYKIDNGILNLEEQSKSVATQIADNSEKLVQAQKETDSYGGAIEGIKKKFTPEERQYAEVTVSKLNVDVTTTQDRLHAQTDKYTRTNSHKDSLVMDSLKKRLVEQMNTTSDSYISNPLVGKDDELKQLRTLEVQYDQARYSKKSLQGQLEILKAQFQKLVPLDATVKTYNDAIANASKEYEDILAKFNQANLQSNSGSKLLQVVTAMPDVAQPSKAKILIIVSGVLMLVFCLVVLFITFYLDNSVKHPLQLANKTNLPVLGYLNKISGGELDLRRLWEIENRDKMQQFKDLLRSIRFEVDQELDGGKVLAITSMKEGEGKTLLAVSLAYSYSMINKKVLLIDGNFENPTITDTVNPKVFVEDIFKKTTGYQEPLSSGTNVVGNHGGDVTLLELGDERYISEKLNDLKRIYDIIIIEAPSLEAMSKAKEWFIFSTKFIAVFEAGKSIVNGKKQMIKYLQRMDTKFAGWVLNKSLTPPKKR
jgi:uncharacterized protein involved in exopolysaccharide biosynthesis/Mrp family chromosome partitioning ATPase